MKKEFSTIKEVLEDIRKGKPIIIVDSENRENEGDLMIAAEKASLEVIAFMIKEASGLMCLPISKKIAEQKGINLITQSEENKFGCNFGIPIDYKIGTTTGMSAYDRLKTIQALCNPNTKANDFFRPGHLFPLIAKNNGVLEREGHTEASIDLCKIAGLKEIAVIIEIIKENGEMARLSDLIEFKKKFSLKMISIQDLIEFRKKIKSVVDKTHTPKKIKKIVETKLPTKFGEFKIQSFQLEEKFESIVLVKGNIEGQKNVLTRIHSQCFTGDILGSLKCDCQNQLIQSMKAIEKKGQGIIIYLGQEGRGIGLINKLKAYSLQEQGYDTVEANKLLGFKADEREYSIAFQILKYFNIQSVELITNNPEKIKQLQKLGMQTKRIPIITETNSYNEKYLQTKKEKLGHLI